MKFVFLLCLTGCAVSFDGGDIKLLPNGVASTNTISPCISRCLEQSAGSDIYIQHNNSYGECAGTCKGVR